MPNGRFVSKSISANEQLAAVSLTADFFFQRCIPHLDVEGRLTGNPQLIKGAIFPLRTEITADGIPNIIGELGQAVDAEGRSLVVWYEVGSQRVLMFPRFKDHQTGMKKEREAASRLPGVESATRILTGTGGPNPPGGPTGSASIDGEVRSESGPTPDQVRQKVSLSEVEGKVEGEVEVQDEVDLDLEHPTDRRADDATGAASGSATASPAAQASSNGTPPSAGAPATLPDKARLLLRRCYGIRGSVPMTDRQKQVRLDFQATLGDRGALLERGVYVRAWDASHLDEACAHVLEQKIKKPDAAIRLVLQYLQKTWQERKAAADKATYGGESAERRAPGELARIETIVPVPLAAAEVAAARSWFEGQTEEFQATVKRQIEMTCPSTKAPTMHERLLSDAIFRAWRTHSIRVMDDDTTARGAA